MCIEGKHDLDGLLRVGRVVALTIEAMRQGVRPGMTTQHLDNTGWKVLREHGARPAPMLTYGFPGMACLSVNDEAAHGVPGKRVIRAGDVVKIDVSAELAGYWADAAITVLVPPVAPQRQRLSDCARAALAAGIAAASAGQRIGVIGRAAEEVVGRDGFNVIRDLPGHGVGRALHEAPSRVPMYAAHTKGRLHEGDVLTVEPHISAGSIRLLQGADGWTLSTADGSLAAAWEHTIVITRGTPVVVTML
jgi:methionyl aminopeptidase